MLESLAFWRSDPYVDLGEQLATIKGDADALALLPYDDGTFFLKPANFDKELIGGQGGYETDDGDKIALDGGGEPVKSLLGVDTLLAVDPTEHASAVEPIKATVAHKHNLGEWIKVDKKGNLIEIGDALMEADGSTPEIDVGESMVGEVASKESMSLDAAQAKLEQEGQITKVMDIAPPAAPVLDEEGNVDLEQATHIAVDQSKAADLMPTTTSTTELNTALDKARMEEYEEGKILKYFVYGLLAGSMLIGVFGIVMLLVMNII